MIKKLISAIVLSFYLSTHVYAASVLSSTSGASSIDQNLGNSGSVSSSSFAIDSALVKGTSGDAYSVKFEAPVSQTSAAFDVYLYLVSETGAPTSVSMDLYAGPSGAMDDDRPSTDAAICSATALNLDGVAANTWIDFSFSSCTLTVGLTYWIVVSNTTGTPASNYPTIFTRGLNGLTNLRMGSYTTTNGYSTDPTSIAGGTDAPAVLKFSAGTIMGNPYVLASSHASNQNDRGVRYTFPKARQFCGFISSIASSVNYTYKLYRGATLLDTITIDLNKAVNTGYFAFTTPVVFEAGVSYDLVLDVNANTTALQRINTNSSDANILAATFSTQAYVDGTTPGSYSVTENSTDAFRLIENDMAYINNSNMGVAASY